jgi:hypothetical protein
VITKQRLDSSVGLDTLQRDYLGYGSTYAPSTFLPRRLQQDLYLVLNIAALRSSSLQGFACAPEHTNRILQQEPRLNHPASSKERAKADKIIAFIPSCRIV